MLEDSNVIHPNFTMNPQHAEVRLHGEGGFRISRLFSSHIIAMLQDFQPEILILMIGDNDVSPSARTSYADAAHTIEDNLLNAVLTLQSKVTSIQKVILSQLLPRHTGIYFRSGYNKIAYYVNDLLRSAVAAEQRLLRVFRFKDLFSTGR